LPKFKKWKKSQKQLAVFFVFFEFPGWAKKKKRHLPTSFFLRIPETQKNKKQPDCFLFFLNFRDGKNSKKGLFPPAFFLRIAKIREKNKKVKPKFINMTHLKETIILKRSTQWFRTITSMYYTMTLKASNKINHQHHS